MVGTGQLAPGMFRTLILAIEVSDGIDMVIKPACIRLPS